MELGGLRVFFRVGSRRDGRLIDAALAERRQGLIGRLFLFERLLQQPIGVGVAE
jgi:hypothetical protein